MDVNKLRELAQKSTQGEWIRIDDHPYLFLNTKNKEAPKAWDCMVVGRFDYETDMEYFRHANPAAILELLDRLEDAERDAARYVAICDYLVSDRTDLDDAFIDAVDKSGINEVLDSIGQQGIGE